MGSAKPTLQPRFGERQMAIRVEIYTTEGMASGILARSGPLRDVLGTYQALDLERSLWQGINDLAPSPTGTLAIPVDDIVFALADDEPEPPIHATWHHVVLDAGPYRLEGELATLPGFDPGRSLARPTGEFVLVRDVRVSLAANPEAGVSATDHALVNRYAVERIRADLMLGFFFPGAAVATAERVAIPIVQPVGGAA
jgi:hypothetical protein